MHLLVILNSCSFNLNEIEFVLHPIDSPDFADFTSVLFYIIQVTNKQKGTGVKTSPPRWR